ncbi:unnamed protein product [Urochloa humidicola]
MAASSPLTVLLFILLLAASAVPATVADDKNSGVARMVIIIRHDPGTRAAGGSTAGARAGNEWRYGRRLVEDEVASEELMIGCVLGAGDDGGGIGYGALDKDRPGCQSGNQCAAQGGGSYTCGCTYKDHCPD